MWVELQSYETWEDVKHLKTELKKVSLANPGRNTGFQYSKYRCVRFLGGLGFGVLCFFLFNARCCYIGIRQLTFKMLVKQESC